MPEEDRHHYFFLYAAQENCTTCVQAWLSRNADPGRGTLNNPDWNALSFAKEAKADATYALLRQYEDNARSRSPVGGSASVRPVLGNQNASARPSEDLEAVPFAGLYAQASMIPMGIWATPPPPPADAPPDAVFASEAPSAVQRFEDFFDDPDGAACQVAAAALSGDHEKLEVLLREFPALGQRPKIMLLDGVPDIITYWTLREYVILARLRADDAGNAERSEALGTVAAILDAAEELQASELASAWQKNKMQRTDASLFQETVRGRSFCAFQNSGSKAQADLQNAALHRVDLQEMARLLQDSDEDVVNPLKTRADLGQAAHPETAHWPLRTCVLARIAIEELEETKQKLNKAFVQLRDWETSLIEGSHAHFSHADFEDRFGLRLLLQDQH
ncbi:unnamed protein product [Symbiodinium sp. CCMP2592]|nr:unnamed protein product [Symbiodinium sp. CCMP2592]